MKRIDVSNANFFRTGGVDDALKIFNQVGLKKRKFKVNAGKNDNINPVVITGFAINGNKIINIYMDGFFKF